MRPASAGDAARDAAATGHDLSERQGHVLRALVTAFVGNADPVGSATLSHLLSVSLSPASIRNTMAELADLGLIEKPHTSSGRVPTDAGFRLFVDRLLDPRAPGDWERRDIAGCFEGAPGEAIARVASDLLSQHTRQLGFVLAPRLDRTALGHVSLVRVSRERVLAVLVSCAGVAHRRVIEDDGRDDQADLDGMASLLNERLAGRTLAEARVLLEAEVRALRSETDRLRRRALEIATRALAHPGFAPSDLVVGTWLALLDQPEFRDPDRLRGLVTALETRERMIEILDRIAAARGSGVAFGVELGEPALRQCALVIAPYGAAEAPVGLVGVLGPSRMDYGRVIPLVDYLSQLVTEKLCA